MGGTILRTWDKTSLVALEIIGLSDITLGQGEEERETMVRQKGCGGGSGCLRLLEVASACSSRRRCDVTAHSSAARMNVPVPTPHQPGA